MDEADDLSESVGALNRGEPSDEPDDGNILWKPEGLAGDGFAWPFGKDKPGWNDGELLRPAYVSSEQIITHLMAYRDKPVGNSG